MLSVINKMNEINLKNPKEISYFNVTKDTVLDGSKKDSSISIKFENLEETVSIDEILRTFISKIKNDELFQTSETMSLIASKAQKVKPSSAGGSAQKQEAVEIIEL